MKRFAPILALLCVFVAITPGFAQEIDYDSIDPSGERITFWHQHDGERRAMLDAIVEEFNQTNEYGIIVEALFQGGYGDIFNQMQQVINTPNAPGLVVAYQNQAATYQVDDGLVDIRPLIESQLYGLTEDEREDFFPAFYGADVFSTFGGARLGFPPNRSAEVMYYNIDWLAEMADAGAIGFDGPPTTPGQFAEAACAAADNPFSGATGSNDIVGYELDLDASRFAAWTFAFGGDIYDYEADQYTYNAPEAVEAMTFLQGLFDDGCAATLSERLSDQLNFAAGTTLFAVGSSSDLPEYALSVAEAAGHAWTIAPVPHSTDEPVVNIYGASVSIPATTPERQLAAWLFLKYFTSPEVQAQWAEASNYFPVRASVAENLEPVFAANEPYRTGFDLLQYGRTEPPVPGYDFVRDLIEEEMAAIVSGAPIEETLDDANTRANNILAEELAPLQ